MPPATDCTSTAAAILAGGQSTRMGRDKAALSFEGKSLLDHALGLVESLSITTVRVCGRPAHPLGISDSHPGGGPVHAILDALESLPPNINCLLVLPVDMPALEMNDLIPLLESESHQVRLWKAHPLPLVIPAGITRPEREQVWSIRRFLDGVDCKELAIPASRQHHFRNINTPGDFAELGKLT